MKNSTRINRALAAKKKFFLFLTLLTLSVGQMWGADVPLTSTFTDKYRAVGDGEPEWDGPDGENGFDNTYGIMYSTTKNSGRTVVLTSSDFTGKKIKKVSVVVRRNKSYAITLAVKVGSTTLGSGDSGANNSQATLSTSSSTGITGGNVEITLSTGAPNKTPGSLYVKSITVEYEPSCNPLTMSTVTATPGNAQIALSWPHVANASSYTVSCKVKSSGASAGTIGSVTGSTTKSCTITGLENGTEYTWSVMPVGSGSYCAENTPAAGDATPNVSRTITYYDKDGQHTTSLTDGTNIATALNALYGVGGPTSCNTTDYEYFVGWKDGEISGSASSVTLLENEVVNATNAAKSYYAVWSDTNPSAAGGWEKASAIAVNDVIVLAYESGGTKKELTSIGLISSNSCGIVSDFSTSVSGTFPLTIVGGNSENSFALKNGDDYLSWSSGNTLTTGTEVNNASSWTISISDEVATITNVGTTARRMKYNTGSPRICCYDNNNSDNVTIYKQLSATANYITTCCEPLGQINGSFKLTQNSASAREFSWANETTASDVDHYELSYKEKTAEGDPTPIANNITNSTHAYTHEANLTEGKTYTYYLKAVGASGHCDATEEVDVLIPYATSTVTFNDNGKTNDGTVPDAITQNTGTTVTVPGNTGNLAKDNYAFGGWNTKDDGTGTNYIADATFTLSNDITLYAKWDCAKKVTLTKGTPSNGSFSLSEANGDKYTCDGSVVVTVSDITPTSGYRLVGITQTGMETGVTIDQANKTVTYAQYANGSSTINVEFEEIPVYTITWSVNGLNSTTNVTDGNALVLPAIEPASCDLSNYGTFVGWYTTAAGSDSDPSDAVSGTKAVASHIPTGNETYYAVWANGTAEGDFALVTDANQLSVGDVVTIANVAGNSQEGKVIKAYASGNNWPTADVTTAANGKIAASTTDMQTFTLAEGTVDDTWAFYDGTGYIYAANSSNGDKNYMKRQETLDAAGSFAIEIDVAASVVSRGDVNGKNTMRYNESNNPPIFSCYGSGKQSAIYLYKQESGATAFISTCCTKHTITLDDEIANGSVASTESSVCEGTSVTLTATATPNAGRFKTWDVTGMTLTNEQKATNPLTISMPDNDITVSATFDALYAITKDQQNGTITLGADYAAAGDNVTISASANPQYKNPVLTIFETGNESNTITVSAGAFTMPAYGVTARVVCAPALDALVPPTLGTEVPTYQGVTLNWTGVAGNEGYVLTVYKDEVAVEGFVDVAIAQNATSYTIASGLAANTDYTYSIYTKGNGTTTMEVNTPANGNFSTEDYPNVTLYYSENGELSAGVSQKILTDFELADPASDPCTKKFVGWSTVTVAETDAEPAMMAPGATYQIPTNANCTLYAVYATEVPGETVYALTPATSLSEGTFVIAAYEGGDDEIFKALTGEVSSGDLVNEAIGFAIDDNKIVSLPNNACEFTFTAVTGGYSIQKPNGDYLGYTSTSDNRKLAFGEYSSLVWSATAHSKDGYPDNGLYLSTSAYRVFHNTTTISTSMIRGYKSTQAVASPIYLFKKTTSDATYSAYATTCTGKVATPSFSGITDGETYEEDKTVSLGCATGEATIRYTMSNDGTTPADPTGESTAATSISLNADGVYVIKAKAFKDGMDASDVATISVTINKPCTTIASFIAVRPSTAKKLVFTAESNAVVLGVNTNRIYIQDPTGGLLLYKTAHEKTWTKGKKVVGTVIGTYAEVDNAPRMLVTDFGETVATIDGEIPSAVVIEGAINANFAANRNKLVTISDLHFQAQSVGGGNSINITRGDDTYQIYNAFNALNDHVLPLTETACSVTGILGYHSNKYQLMPIDANCITTGATAVLPEFVGETGGADAEHPTEVASGEVIKLTAAEGMTSNYTIGESAPVSITTNTEAVISGANNDLIAITISAEREYYTDNSVTYYYKINNALTKYIITSAVVENGTFKVKNSDASAEITSAVAGATVTLVAEPTHTETAQYSLDHWTVYETGNTSNTVSVENNQFIMPSFAVTVSATFAEDAYATVVFDGGDATGTAPAGGKKYVGQEVTMPNKGALVKANHVLASWTYNETEYAVGDTYEIQEGDAAIGGKDITFTANWTPYPWANGGDWMLVTNAAEVTAGSYVIIAAAASNVAMSTTQNNNNRAQQSISKNDNLLTYTTAPAIFEVRAGNIENTLAFYDVVNEGYIYAAGSGKSNHLRTEDDLSNNSSWIIEDITSAGVAEVEAQGTNTNNKLQHNSSSSLFSCYNDYSQSSIALYKYYAPVPKVTYDKNTEDEVTNMPNPSVQRAENNKAVIAAGPSRTGYTFEGWKNGNTTYTVGEEYTFTEDITLYAQWEALPSFHVTYNTSGSQGTTPTDATNYYEGDPVTLASASGLSNAGYFFAGWNDGTSTYPAGGEYTMPGSNVTFTAVWSRESAQKWALVKQGDELEINGEYIIASTVDAKTYALGDITTMGSNKVGQPLVVDRNGDIVKGSEAMVVYTLVAGNGDNTYAFKNSDNDYLMWSSGNTLNKTNELNNTSSWKISIGDGNIATIKNVSDETRKMQYNSSQPRFACYTSAQKDVQLFKKVALAEISTSVDASTLSDNTDVIIREGGVLNVNNDKTIGDLTVEAGGEVTLSSNKLTVVGTFTIETTMASGESGQLNGATELNFEAQEDAYIDITLGDNGNPEKWHAFTVPFPVDAINGIYDLDGKKLVNEVNYAIMDYHGDIRATGNYGWKKYRGVLVPGTFYLMTVDGLRTTYRFKKKAGEALVAGNSKTVYEYAASGEGESTDAGWNGIGNPTLMYGKVNAEVQVLDPVNYVYVKKDANTTNFVVGTPFFYQASGDGSIAMLDADAGANYAPARTPAKGIEKIKVAFGNEAYADYLDISASEEALNEYQIGKDLVKMTMTSTPKVAQIFGKAYNAKLCMVYAPMANDQAVYDLTLYAPKAGEYTIAAPNVENTDLYLTYEGSIIWDLSMSAYPMELKKGNNEGYGLLLQAKMPMTPTGIVDVQGDNVQCTKVVIDEHVYILRGGEMYDVTGKAVK